MSIEDVLEEVRGIAGNFRELREDVDALTKRMDEREQSEEERARSSERQLYRDRSRSRSRTRTRSPSRFRGDRARSRSRHRGRRRTRSRSRSRSRQTRARSRSRDHRARSRSRSGHRNRSRSPWLWADRSLDEAVDYEADPQFSDEEDEGQLAEVSERTHKLLTTTCTRGMSLDTRKRTRGKYKLPHVEATRTPKVDHVMRALATPAAKSSDREFSKIQTFMLDSLAPLSCLTDHADKMSVEDIREASSAAASLIGNANVQMSKMRREKYVASFNRELVPLVKENGNFATVAPNLFGPDFSKRATDHLVQVSRLRKKSNPHPYQRGSGRKQFFRKGFPSGRGSARGRGGGPNYHHKNHGEKQSRP